MSNEFIIQALKYAGFGVAALSAIWGLISKISYEDEQGNKRLTRAGQVAAGLVIGSMLIGMTAFGFETIAKNLKDSKDASEAAVRIARQAAEEREALRRHLDQQERINGVRAEQVRLLNVSLKAETAQRSRDLMIAGNVRRAAAEDFARATAAMGQMNRLLTRLGGFDFELAYWARIPDGESATMRRLDALFAQRLRDPTFSDPASGVRFGGVVPGRLSWVEIDQSSPLFPRPGDSLYPIVTLDDIWVTISQNASQDWTEIIEAALRSGSPFYGDIFFPLGSGDGRWTLRYSPRGTVRVIVRLENADRLATRTARLASIEDLRNASLVLRLKESARDRVFVERISLDFGGRRFRFHITRSHRGELGPAYIVPQMRTPLF